MFIKHLINIKNWKKNYKMDDKKNGQALVNIPIKVELNDKEVNIIDKNSYALEDLYTIVHEVIRNFQEYIQLYNLDIEER